MTGGGHYEGGILRSDIVIKVKRGKLWRARRERERERERKIADKQTSLHWLDLSRGDFGFSSPQCLVILIRGVTWVSIRSKGRRSIYWIRLQRPSYNILIQRGKPEMLTKILEKQYPYIVYKISAFFLYLYKGRLPKKTGKCGSSPPLPDLTVLGGIPC